VAVPRLAQTLQRLALMLTVKDLMVPAKSLTCAEREKDAPALSDENPDFNVIPIKKRKQITSYYERDSGQTKPITTSDLISDGTSILELLSTLEKRPFCFVLTHAQIAGYVHFSDLNHPFVRLALYTIIEAMESSALAMISSVRDGQNLGRLLGKTRLKKIERRLERARKRDANRSWADFLNIVDTLRIAVKESKICLNEQEIKAITRMRNRVSHQGAPLVRDFNGAIELARIAGRCVQVLDAV
jgi:hypothetical protein